MEPRELAGFLSKESMRVPFLSHYVLDHKRDTTYENNELTT
jgi:hypothetical protein